VRDRVVAVEELHACHISNSGSMPRKELLLKFRGRARKAAGVAENTKPFRKLFIDRSDAKRRKLVNQRELEKVLDARGFELIRWEAHSMAEQIRIASETSVMAGPHGTNLLNSIYCQPGAKLMEIINPLWWDAATLRQASLVGHEFWYCFGADASPEHDTRIAPDKLARVLDYMLEADVCEVPPEETGREVRTF
jgi:capsular polysaccharide biosynthesis protein